MEICSKLGGIAPVCRGVDSYFALEQSSVILYVAQYIGTRNKPENYRPVSLTSVVCKLLETLIRDNMVEFLVKHNLINTSQHGFLKARSNQSLMFFGRNYKVGR